MKVVERSENIIFFINKKEMREKCRMLYVEGGKNDQSSSSIK